LDVIKQLTAGDIETDSVQSLDSLQRVEKGQLVAEPNEATETFKAQYEQKERDRLLLFDNTANHSVRQLHRPVRGVVVQSARPDLRLYGVSVRTAKNENIMATTRGTLLSVERMADNTFTLVLQNDAFVTVYRHVSRALKTQGTMVEQGESIGLMDSEQDLMVELWNAGQFVNPEEVIVW
jgi:septal ring factor EnvC (AmiA/AmiB activator)